MKMKKFFSGILAAVMSIAVIAAPVSTARATDTDGKCTIYINHGATSGTYTAYPIFTGNVELSNDEDTKGKLVIDSPKFHPNLETTMENNTAATLKSRSENENYALHTYLNNNGTKVTDGKSFFELIKAYDPNWSSSNGFNGIVAASASSGQAEAIANTLNLTGTCTAVTQLLGDGTKTSAFYSAFAEAARNLMADKIIASPGTVVSYSASANGNTAVENDYVIEVDEPGYYLVEWTPEGYNETNESVPRSVRRSLVLVGRGETLAATINSKDTQNIASVDIQFNETMLVRKVDGSFDYADDNTEGNWAKNVSAGNGDYVNCRVVVTLPGNFSVYDQYYLAIPIMYGYNVSSSSNFDFQKSITRVKGSIDNPLQNIKFYFLGASNNQVKITKDVNDLAYDNNLTDVASEIFDAANAHNAKFEIKDTYAYANDTTGTDADKFTAAETFVISDIANMNVRSKTSSDAEEITKTLKWRHDNDTPANSWNKLVIEFPVQFNRFQDTLPDGVATPGYNSNSTFLRDHVGNDALLKNYISAKAVYSNNPNLKALKTGETAYDKTNTPNGVKLYLDTSKEPGTLQNPVGVSKESSANIVTYRLRVHATTNDYKTKLAGGLEGVYFALKNSEGKYATVKLIGDKTKSYDQVSADEGFIDSGFGNTQLVRLYVVTGWEAVTDLETNYKTDATHILQTNQALNAYNETKASNNAGRFEILGLAPGTYTVVALENSIKAKEQIGTAGDPKDYKLPKEDGNPKTDYKFSFAPTLVDTCTKLPYFTHYAPVGSPAASTPSGSAVIVDENKLIENFNLKWLKGDTEIADKPEWWIGQSENVALMSMRVTYIKKGLTLPVTGGIGTFIFFTVGGALVVISTVAIVTRFRVKRERL